MSGENLKADEQQGCSTVMAGPTRAGWRSETSVFGKLYTVSEIAGQLKVSTDTVIRLFKDEKGVIDLGRPATKTSRRYHILRIPEAVLRRVVEKRRVQ